MVTRREFLDTMAVGAAGLAIGASAKSYGQILGANERLNFAVIGLNGRAYAHLSSLKANKDATRIAHVCDVDSNILAKFAAAAQKEMGEAPATHQDFRKILELKDVDAITIATPDHWHAPMAILGLQAGKHVYVEKPCSHNPGEGALLVRAQKKYGKLVQMGTQQRSSPHTIEIVDKIHDGTDWPRVLREGLVQQHAQVDRHWQRSARARDARLGPVAGPRAAPTLQGQCAAIQLALVLDLGNGRDPQQRDP